MLRVIDGTGAALVLLSVVLALCLARAAVTLAGRVAHLRGWPRAAWLFAASLGIGSGLWSLHFVGALALIGPDPIPFRLLLGALSIGLSLSASALALSLVGPPRPRWFVVVGASLLIGPALAAVHYAGMAALGIRGISVGDPVLPMASALGATLASVAGISAATRYARQDGAPAQRWLWINSFLLLAALVGVYYSGAVAVRFGTADAAPPGGSEAVLLVREIAYPVSAAVLLLLLGSGAAARIDRRVRRRRAETEALRRSEDRFRSLVQASAQIVWTTSPDGQMRDGQASWREFTGQEPEDYRGWGWFNAVHPEDRERTARMWEEALANRKPLEMEHRVRRHDGRYRDCVARVVPVREADGSVREWMGTHTDATDRARMQEERELLAEAGRVLSSSLDYRETLGTVAGLLVPRLADWCTIDVRLDGGSHQRLVSTHVDPHRAALLREMRVLSADSRNAHGAGRVLRTGESELLREVTDALLAKLAPEPEQLRLLRTIGLTSLVSVPLVARGHILGVLTLALAEAGEHYDLRDLALAEELARRSAVAIDNARLYEEAQNAIRARDEVLGVVSHDLRNPISTISMSAELLADMDLPPEQERKQLDIIRRSAAGMNRLIQDLLDVSRTESGTLSVDPHPEDPAAIAAEACEVMRPLAAERSQSLTGHAADDLPRVTADRSRLLQVLSNLIGNAVKFTPEGGSIRVQVATAEGGVRFSVVDTGPGVAPEELPRLFDRHWQAKRTAHLGAGLGLAISRGIVEAHGGRIWAESEVGHGTAVHFTLPAAMDEPERDPAVDALPQRPARTLPTQHPVG